MIGECESQGDLGSVKVKVMGECESQGDGGV